MSNESDLKAQLNQIAYQYQVQQDLMIVTAQNMAQAKELLQQPTPESIAEAIALLDIPAAFASPLETMKISFEGVVVQRLNIIEESIQALRETVAFLSRAEQGALRRMELGALSNNPDDGIESIFEIANDIRAKLNELSTEIR